VVEAADQGGTPLVPPSPTPEERERSQQEAIADLTRVGTFSFSDYALFGATALIVYRLMLYGMARLGPWQGGLGATIAILAVFAYVDGDIWKRLSFSLKHQAMGTIS
jgi:hypothetical protein